MVASTVSSKMIEAMAQVEGFKFSECLTGRLLPSGVSIDANDSLGFKYIGNTGLSLEHEGYEVPFGYEEAIGFMFGSQLRDKDGVAASVSSDFNRYMDPTHAVTGNVWGACHIFADTRQDCKLIFERALRAVCGLSSS